MNKIIKIGTAQADRGEIGTGTIKGIELSNGTYVDIPVVVLNGIEDGPTLLIVSTEHGDEIQGIEVIRQILRHKIDPKTLKGVIIAIPVANPLAFMHHLYTSWIDNLDVRRVDASSLENSPTTGILANRIWEEAYKKADFIINIHANSLPNALVYQGVSITQPETRITIEKMAKAFGVTTIYQGENEKVSPETALSNLAQSNGIPCLLVELVDGGHISEPSTTVGVRGILNVMKAFNMISGNPESQTEIPIVLGHNRFYKMVLCTRGGIIHPTKTPGEFINKDEVIARIFDVWGEEIEIIYMPVDGYIWAYPLGQQLGTAGRIQTVNSGDFVAYIFIQEK